MTDKSQEGDLVEQLIQSAGPSPTVEAVRKERVRASVHSAWVAGLDEEKRQHQSRFLKPFYLSLATAASLLLAVFLVINSSTAPVSTSLVVAKVVRIEGKVFFASQPQQYLEKDALLFPGQFLNTSTNSGVALRMGKQQSLRLAAETSIQIIAPYEFVLIEGAVYFDSANEVNRTPIKVQTHAGVVSDIGTQFEVKVRGEKVRIRVRDGVVKLKREGIFGDNEMLIYSANSLTNAENEIVIDGGEMKRDSISSDDAQWGWAQDLAPVFVLDGSSLHEVLNWFARENGLQLRFANQELETSAKTNILHGSIEGMSGSEALSTVGAISNIEYEIKGRELLIN